MAQGGAVMQTCAACGTERPRLRLYRGRWLCPGRCAPAAAGRPRSFRPAGTGEPGDTMAYKEHVESLRLAEDGKSEERHVPRSYGFLRRG